MFELAKKRKEKVFNDRKRKIFRKRISGGETAFGVVFILIVFMMGVWFASRKDKYDPAERDVSMAAMVAGIVEDNLYETPLKRWVDPAQVIHAGMIGPDLGIFPASIVSDSWVASSRLQEFDSTNLYEKINGQEGQYKQFGFERLYFISVANLAEGLEISIELYDMGTFSNALGIFAAQRSEGTQVTREGSAFYYSTEVGALGILNKYFFKLTGNEAVEAIQAKALEFVRDFSTDASGSSETPGPLMVLAEGLGVAFQDIEYVVQDVFQYDFVQDFWFGKPDPATGLRFYVHEAEGGAEASALFERILNEHIEYEMGYVGREGNNALFKHEFLNTYNTLNQTGPYVYGLEGAQDEGTASSSLSLLRDVLQKKSGLAQQ